MSPLADLIAALEGALPSPKLNNQVAVALGWVKQGDSWLTPCGSWAPEVPNFVGNLGNAWHAVTALGWHPGLQCLMGGGEPSKATVAASIGRPGLATAGNHFVAFASTPAAALMACLMKSVAHEEGKRPQSARHARAEEPAA